MPQTDNDILSEQALLGMVLYDPSVLPDAVEKIKPEFFYLPLHRDIFALLVRMFSDSRTEDIIAVINEAVSAGIFESTSNAQEYLSSLMDRVSTLSNLDSYCNAIIEKYRIRQLVEIAKGIIEQVSQGTDNSSALLDKAEQDIYDIRKSEVKGLSRIDSVIIEAYQHLQEISGENAQRNQSLRSGFDRLDNITNGLNKSDLIVLAARPAMGKSAFAINMAVNACRSSNKDVALFSLEMGKEQLALRMLSSVGLVDNSLLRSGKLENSEWERLVGATDILSKLPIYVDDGAGITVPQMKAKLRRLKNLGLVVIDYLQLMESPNKHSSRVNEVSEITRQLKLMAKELNVPVIALSQLARSSEKREDKRPILSDLRESGSIEQDADIVMFLYRSAYYDKNVDQQDIAECIVAKNRHGETSTVKLSFQGEFQLFRGLDMRNE